MKITLEDIFNIPTAVIYNPDLYKSTTAVEIDSRKVKKNSIFVAIKGANFDGHNFIKQAIKSGASALVVSNRKINDLDDVEMPVIAVQNTIKAYGELAKIWRSKMNAKVISITGSNGKTTTKEILSHLLEGKYKVYKTEANNNNHIGVPLTIFSAPKNTEALVLEHGTNHFGEIEYSARIAKPDYALITNIGDSHLKYLKNRNEVFKEKKNLFDALNENGTTIINLDDVYLRKLIGKYNSEISFSLTKKADVNGEIISVSKNGNYKIKIFASQKSFEVELPILGEANVKNYLAAVTLALQMKVSIAAIKKQTKSLEQIKGRLFKTETKKFTLIDDTYNANPESVSNALDLLDTIKTRKNKIVILGDMFELGSNSEKLHKSLSRELNKLKNVSLLTIGKSSKSINDSVKKSLNLNEHFKTRTELKKKIRNLKFDNSVILVKGSRGMKMEEFVKEILEQAA